MIFVTVGTHEQSFKRLIEKIDNMIGKGIIEEEVFMQIGYTDNYIPKNCKYKKLITNDEMYKYCEEARIIITHGGPGSIMLPFRLNKVPVVVPRNPKYDEHVDRHQILFTNKLEEFNKIIGVYDIEDLEEIIPNYDKYSSKCSIDFKSTLKSFIDEFEKQVEELMCKKSKKKKREE